MKKYLLALAILIMPLCIISSSFAKNIAIIGAMDSEIQLLVQSMHTVKVEKHANITFYLGKLEGKDVVIFKSGVGKVNAAISTTMAIERYDISSIIFTGVAGAVAPKLNITDIVIADSLIQHDYDTSALGEKRGNVPGSDKGRFHSDITLRTIAKKSAINLLGVKKVHIGTIVTGDQFIADPKKVQSLHKEFKASAVEMEGAAVAQVAHLYNIPIVVIRVMSDKADGSAHMNYTEFVTIAADSAASIVKNMLSQL